MTTLYRVYDKNLELLYAGISERALRRLKEHSKSKPDWTTARWVLLDHYDTREYAAMIEAETIQEDAPRWNIVHRRDHEVKRPTASDADILWSFHSGLGSVRR